MSLLRKSCDNSNERFASLRPSHNLNTYLTGPRFSLWDKRCEEGGSGVSLRGPSHLPVHLCCRQQQRHLSGGWPDTRDHLLHLRPSRPNRCTGCTLSFGTSFSKLLAHFYFLESCLIEGSFAMKSQCQGWIWEEVFSSEYGGVIFFMHCCWEIDIWKWHSDVGYVVLYKTTSSH